jgi:hypothetical protein
MHYSARLFRAIIISFTLGTIFGFVLMVIAWFAYLAWALHQTGLGLENAQIPFMKSESAMSLAKISKGGLTIAEIDAELGLPGEDVPFERLPDSVKSLAVRGEPDSYRRWVIRNDRFVTSVLYFNFEEGKSGKPYTVLAFEDGVTTTHEDDDLRKRTIH